MTAVSDRALRRLAWVVPAVLGAVVAGKLLVAAGHPSLRTDAGGVGVDLLIATFPITALVILLRRPRNRIGWLLMGISLVWMVGGLADLYAAYGLVVAPGALVHPDVAAAVSEVIWAPAIGLMGTFLILLFPDGHLPSPRWRPFAWVCAGTIGALTLVVELTPGRLANSPVPTLRNPLGLEAARPVLSVLFAGLAPLLPLCILVSAVALAVRYRHAHGVERLQMKWLVTAGVATACVYLTGMVASLASGSLTGTSREPGWVSAVDAASFLSFLLLPVAIAFAVSRYRLYDIDTVISRTLAYGLLTLLLAGTYVASVLILQRALSPLTRQSDLAVAVSTLVVAALFRPARARIQTAVDRRFHRRRYDAERTLDSFSARLRHELDLDAVAADLHAAVTDTLQPAHVSLWLSPSSPAGLGAVTLDGRLGSRKATP